MFVSFAEKWQAGSLLDAKYSPVLVCRYLSVSLPVLGVLRVTDGPLFCGGELQFRIHKYN